VLSCGFFAIALDAVTLHRECENKFRKNVELLGTLLFLFFLKLLSFGHNRSPR
jgi:hypothetical protein